MSIDKAAIVKQVLQKVAVRDTESILTAAGHFDLLEAAQRVARHRCTGSKADRPDYIKHVPCADLWALVEALRKAGVEVG